MVWLDCCMYDMFAICLVFIDKLCEKNYENLFHWNFIALYYSTSKVLWYILQFIAGQWNGQRVLRAHHNTDTVVYTGKRTCNISNRGRNLGQRTNHYIHYFDLFKHFVSFQTQIWSYFLIFTIKSYKFFDKFSWTLFP